MSAQCRKLIVVDESRGRGEVQDPHRCVVAVYEEDGTGVAERDPCAPRYQVVDGSWRVEPELRLSVAEVDRVTVIQASEAARLFGKELDEPRLGLVNRIRGLEGRLTGANVALSQYDARMTALADAVTDLSEALRRRKSLSRGTAQRILRATGELLAAQAAFELKKEQQW